MFYHVHDFEVPIGESNGVWWGCHWQHECQGGADGAGQHNVKRMETNVASLGMDSTLLYTMPDIIHYKWGWGGVKLGCIIH